MDSRDTDAWIAELTKRKWTHFYFPNRDAPVAMASVFWHCGYVDVIQLFAEADAFAYRAPMELGANPFRPAAVMWHYGGVPIWTIRATLALSEPESPYAPTTLMTPPPMCRALPDIIERIPGQAIRPPSHPTRAGSETPRA